MKALKPLTMLAFLTGISSGATIIQTKVITPYTASGNAIATFDKFDTQGGTRTLTGVTISFSFDKLGGSYAVDNDSAAFGSITFNHELKGRLTSSDVSVGTAGTYLAALSEFTTSVGTDDGDPQSQFDTGGPDYVVYNPADILGTTTTATIEGASWAAYTGTNTFNVNFQASQTFGVDGVGGLQSQTIASQVAPTVEVIYTYTAVPEPASALLGGLGILTLLRRRRR